MDSGGRMVYIVMEKNEIRKKVSSLVCAMDDSEKRLSSKKVCEKILSLGEYISADFVLSYMPMKNEIDVTAVSMSALSDGKKLFLPRTENSGNGMDFYFIDAGKSLDSQIKTGRWNIMEPESFCEKLDFEILYGKKIFMLVPGVAFSESGRRLGHGMGFYDIYVSRIKKIAARKKTSLFLVGAAFPCQIDRSVDQVSKDHDLSVDFLVC